MTCTDSEDGRDSSVQTPPSFSTKRNITAAAISNIGTECSICFVEFEEGDLITFSHNSLCTHFFHKECIVSWLARDDRCPTCRRDYLNNDKEENKGDAKSGESIDSEENSSSQV